MNTAIKMLIVLAVAIAVAATTEALRGPRRLEGNATFAAHDDESALFEDEKHFLSEVELREYLDEAMSGRPPPPASHPIRSV